MASNVLPQKSLLDDVLECSLCLHIYESPHTLQNCLHTFCLACIQEIPKTETDPENISNGWKCPVCDIFSSEALLLPNSFLADLIQKKTAPKGLVKQACKQCSSNSDATHRCMDCKLELCDSCCDIHLKIPLLKDHNISSIKSNTDGKMIVDNLVFCPNHDKDKPAEINCQECQEMICLKCKVNDHNKHTVEMFETAIESLLPKLESSTEMVDEYLEVLEENIKVLRQKIEDTKINAKCKTEVNNRLADLVAKLTQIKCEREEQLAEMEKDAIEKLENIKLEMEKAFRYGENLKKLSEVTRAHATNMTLLHEIQGGLLEKLEQLCHDWPHHEVQFEISLPYFLDKMSETDEVASLDDMFGTVTAHKRLCLISEGQESGNSPFICENFLDIVHQNYRFAFNVNLPCWCNRISYINGMVWVPLPSFNEVRIYTTSGELIQTLVCFQQPYFVTQMQSGDLLIGGKSRLYMSNLEGTVTRQISNTGFSDASVMDFAVVLPEHGQKDIRLFNAISKRGDTTKQPQLSTLFSAEEINETFDDNSTILASNNSIFISLATGTIFKFTKKGKFVKKRNINVTMLCVLDKANNILAVEFSTGHFVILNEDLEVLSDHSQLKSAKHARDVIVDSDQNIWILTGFRNDYTLTKYVAEM